MASGKLNSLSIERAHRFGGAVLLSDGDGLYFRKQTREGAAWMFRYRFAGRERWMTLGNFPDMSLDCHCTCSPRHSGLADHLACVITRAPGLDESVPLIPCDELHGRESCRTAWQKIGP